MPAVSEKSVKKNALLSVIKQLFSIIFPMITFPYAMHVLGVDNYGKYTFSASIVNYISYIAAAGILRYAIRECSRVRDNKLKLSKLVNEIFTINICCTIVAYVILFILLLTVPLFKEYIVFILIISLSVVFATVGTDWINSAFEDYFFITIRYIVCQFIALIMLFVLVRTPDDIAGYAFVTVLGGILANILNVVHIRKTMGVYPKFVFSKELIQHIKPVMYLFASTIATFIYINSDITILRIFTGDTAVGYYGASTQYYQLVKQVVNAAFIVVIPRISHELANKKEEAFARYNEVLTLTILLIVPSAVGLYMIRKSLIFLFSGEVFMPAESSLGILAVALIPAMLANFFINIVMIPLKREKQVMIATVASAALNIALNFVLIPRFEENAAALTTLLAEVSMMLIAIVYCKDIKFGSIVKPAFVSALGGAAIFGVCFVIGMFIDNYIADLLVSVFASVVVYAVVAFAFYKNDPLLLNNKILKKLK